MRTQIDFGMNVASYGKGAAISALLSLALVGCGSEESPTNVPLGETQRPALGVNALGVNALGVNALGVNALGVNALGVNALGVNALGVNGLNWLHDSSAIYSTDRAQLLKYLVKCALGPTQSLAAHAAHDRCVGYQQLPGLYGLAQNWPTQALNSQYEQQLVTACVLAHVNEKGTPQAISLHGAHGNFGSVPAERATMYASEGRYWGNIFRTELWKNVCTSSGRSGGAASPYNFDIILGRSCAQDGCGVMTSNGICPTTPTTSSDFNNWFYSNSITNLIGYSTWGFYYQPASQGSTIPNNNGLFPTVEALSPVSLEFEGITGTLGSYPTGCRADATYNDGKASAAISDISLGSGSLFVGDCNSANTCAGGVSPVSPYGAKLRGMPTGMRLRYTFLTAQSVGLTQFKLKVRYSSSGSNVKARFRVNGYPWDNVNGTYTFPSTGSWDTYDTIPFVRTFVTAPSGLPEISCKYTTPNTNGFVYGNPYVLPYAIYLEVEAEPGATFPDLDAVWLEPLNT